MSEHLFLVSYILDNQPQTREIRVDAETMSVEEATHYLTGVHTDHADAITDVQVTKISHEHEEGTTPGHYQQP